MESMNVWNVQDSLFSNRILQQCGVENFRKMWLHDGDCIWSANNETIASEESTWEMIANNVLFNVKHFAQHALVHVRFHFGYDLNVPVSIGVHRIAPHKKCRQCANSSYHILKKKPHKKCKRLFYYVKLLPHKCIVFSLRSDRTQIPFQVSLLKSESNEPNTNVPNIGLLLSWASISTIHANLSMRNECDMNTQFIKWSIKF